MKKLILYALLLGAAMLLPAEGTDVGELLPVELISIYKEADTVIIDTDTGASGTGETILAAVSDLKATAPGNVFLDTADFLLISDLDDQETEALKGILKPAIRVCETEGRINPERAVEYLRIHKPEQRLDEWTAAKHPQQLTINNGKLMLELF